MAACAADDKVVEPKLTPGSALRDGLPQSGPFSFSPLAASTVCTNGGDANKPLTLPTGFSQVAIAHEPDFADSPDMNTQNETGAHRGRFVYRPAEVGSNASVSVTDLETGVTKIIAQRADWESLDPTAWTPWGTLLIAEETNAAARRDPDVPQAVAGLVYELFFDNNDPTVVTKIVPRPAIGSKSHEGMRFDPEGNLYSISERTPGYIYKFTPDKRGDLSSGQLYAMKVTQPDGPGTGIAEWVPLDRTKVQIDAGLEGDRVGATGYGRPEDVEYSKQTIFAAITSEHRVIAIDLTLPGNQVRVYNYVARGVNTDNEFNMPDNLAMYGGDLYITEDPGGNTASGKKGDDIWVAGLPTSKGGPAGSVRRFASLTDCEAEPTGLYFDIRGGQPRLFVNIQHRGGDRIDKTMAITQDK